MYSRSGLVLRTLIVLALCGCGGGGSSGDGGGGGGTTSAAPPATVSLSLSKTAVRAGDSTMLTWSSTGATSCTAAGAWSGSQKTSGSLNISATVAGTSTYQLSCAGTGAAATASATLTVAAPLTQVTVPGLPAPVPVASGDCVPYSDGNVTITCITSAGAVPAKYGSFSSSISASVILNGNSTPTVQTGGSCTGGFNASSGQFAVNTTVGNDAIAFTGSTVMEVVFSSAYLASLGVQGTITSLSALVISDNSNTDHFQVVMYAIGPSGPFTLATGGTVSSSGTTLNVSMLECLGSVSTVAPPPPPASLTCPSGRGTGTNGLGFASAQSLQYTLSTTTANQTSNDTLTWGVSFNNPQLAATSYTGTLRVSLYAVPSNFQGSGQISGYPISRASPNFTGAGAKSSNQLFNGYSVSNILSSVSGGNPPAGHYCMVMSLDQYNTDPATCSAADHFCYVDWAQFPGAQAFN